MNHILLYYPFYNFGIHFNQGIKKIWKFTKFGFADVIIELFDTIGFHHVNVLIKKSY